MKTIDWLLVSLLPLTFALGWAARPLDEGKCVNREDFMTECPYCDKKLTIKITKERMPGGLYGYDIEVYKGWPKDFRP